MGKKILCIILLVFAGMAIMGGIGGGGSKEVPENVLDYLGTKESDVYRVYDKSGFEKDPVMEMFGYEDYTNEATNHSGLPHIFIHNKKVYTIRLESGMNASFHVNGVHIGDNISTANRCLEEASASKNEASSDLMEVDGKLYGVEEFHFSYKGKDVTLIIRVEGDLITLMSVFYNED